MARIVDEKFPKVSIIIPVYNGSDYLNEAIESALGQDYPNFEVIVVNDGSTDLETEKIALSYGNKIQYFYKTNGGVASALNLGINKMTGEYFSWLSHDDRYKKEKLSKQISALKALNDSYRIVASGYEVIDAEGKPIGINNPLDNYSKEKLERPLFAVFKGAINGCTLLIHKSHFDRVGLFNEGLPYTQDYDMWFRILRDQKIFYLDGLYVESRSHQKQGSRQLGQRYLQECEKLWIHLFRSLRPDEILQMSDSSLDFYKDEKRFFSVHTPYHSVAAYAEKEMLDELYTLFLKNKSRAIDIWEKEYPNAIPLNEIMDKNPANRLLAKTVYLVAEKDYRFPTNLTQMISRALGIDKFELFIVAPAEVDKIVLENSNQQQVILFPQKQLKIFSAFLTLLKASKYIFHDSCFNWISSEYLHFSEMGINFTIWNTKPYHSYFDINYLKEGAVWRHLISKAELVIWEDIESFGLYAVNHSNSRYVPNFSKASSVCDQGHFSGYSEKLYRLYEDYIYDLEKYKEQQTIYIEKPVYRLVENKAEIDLLNQKLSAADSETVIWKQRYQNITNSFFWKATYPLRKGIDMVKHGNLRNILKVIYHLFPSSIQHRTKNLILNGSVEKINIYHESAPKCNVKNPLKISVVIPNYNYEKYITERIDSVLRQTYPIYELIILDDCSTDNSISVIEEKIKTIPSNISVRFLKNNTNSGNVFAQWQKAFQEAQGDYVWIAEADDSCNIRFLETVVKGFQNKNVVLSYCESLTIDSENIVIMHDLREWIDIFNCHKWDRDYWNNGLAEIKETLCINNTIANASSVVFKNGDYEQILEEAKQFELAGDWYVYMRIIETGDICYFSDSLNYHRMHNKGVTLTINHQRDFDEIVRMQDYALNRYTISDDVKEKIFRRREEVRTRYGL